MSNSSKNKLACLFMIGATFVAPMVAITYAPAPAQASNINEFMSKDAEQQVAEISKFIGKLTRDVAETDPVLAQQINDYFLKRSPETGEREGLRNFFA